MTTVKLITPNLELEALMKVGIPKGTWLSLCNNQGTQVTVEGRLWWGFPLVLTINGKSKTRFGVDLIRSRVPYEKAESATADARVKMREAFPDLKFK